MRSDHVGAIAGAAAGAIATAAVIHPLMSIRMAKFPRTAVPLRQDPGEFVVDQVERLLPGELKYRVPRGVENAAVRSVQVGYGVGFGTLYGLVRKKPGNVFVDGLALGLVTRAAGYLGWLPATKLMPPVTEQRADQIVPPILEHVAFGVGAVAALRGIRAALDAMSTSRAPVARR
jgi:hypothetical protein